MDLDLKKDPEYQKYIRNLQHRAEVSFERKKTQDILERLNEIHNAGMLYNKKLDIERAYIFIKRWILCVKWLKTQKVDEANVKKYYPSEKYQSTTKVLKDLVFKIEQDYKLKRDRPRSQNIQNCKDINDIIFPEVPTEEPQPKDKDDIKDTSTEQITCTELFNMLRTNNKNVLLVDIRKLEQFNTSRISFQDNLINIPEDKIDLKKSLIYNQNFLQNDKEVLNKIHEKTSKLTELIVLFDSNSSLETRQTNNPMLVFKHCLGKLDASLKCSKTVILKGGFEEWIKTYPAYVTNEIVESTSIHNLTNDVLDKVNYHSEKNDINLLPNLSNVHKVNSKVNPLSNISDTAYVPNNPSSFSLINHDPSINLSDFSPILSSNNQNLIIPGNSITSIEKPTPVLPVISNGSYYNLEKNQNDKDWLKSNNIKEAQLILRKVDKPYPEKPLVDRSNKPVPGRKISSNAQTPKGDENMFNNWNYELNKNKELSNINSDNTFMATTGNKLYPDISTMSLDSKKMFKPARVSKINFSAEKENTPREIVEKTVEPLPPMPMEVDDNAETYKERLKYDSPQPKKSGIKRSISSPNLVQEMDKEERPMRPEIDRSSKPRLDSANDDKQYFVIEPKDREKNLNGVLSSIEHPGITGLKNLGNSCYMNSIIQCLSNTECLAKYFIENTYTHHLKHNDKNVTCVAEEVAHVIKALWRGTYKSISPFDLKVIVGHYKLQFKNHEQQDSHEFLTFLLEWMHNDLKRKSKISYSRPLTTIESEWEKSMNGQSSMISELFFGLLRSTVQCLYCKKISTTYETFNSLTMSLPDSNKCSLDDCVKKFVSGQKVSGWNCPDCKVPREGEKKFDIAKLPHIVVIHLNRFGDTGGWLEKKDIVVDFPLAKFDLSPYLVSDDSINSTQRSCYNLYAISNHYGTMDRGHYTAYCKISAQNKWYKYDDHTVTEVPQNQVKNQGRSAYLLFYTSISTDILRE